MVSGIRAGVVEQERTIKGARPEYRNVQVIISFRMLASPFQVVWDESSLFYDDWL